MSEYVSKEELKEFFESIEITVAGRTRAEAIGEVLQAIYIGVMELPTTDAVPVKRGKWIETDEWDEFSGRLYKCSNCKTFVLGYFDNYCPFCGADMKGTEDD